MKFVLIATLIGAASAACPNQCSGHGSCGNQDVCECYDNWGMGGGEGGDCSDRLCPFELAWVDAPNSDNSVHQYAECAAKGICDRGTGECACLDGYDGKACARQTCKDGCNGHGTCAYMSQIPFGTVYGDHAVNTGTDAWMSLGKVGAQRYESDDGVLVAWDAERARACICDAEWSGISCANKMCPHGNDAMFVTEYTDAADYDRQIQTLTLVGNAAWTSAFSFALTFTSRTNSTFTTVPISFGANTAMVTSITSALEGLPNAVIDEVVVTASGCTTVTCVVTVQFTGDGVQGRQNLLELDVDPCGAGCTPLVTGLVDNIVMATSGIWESTDAAFNSYECGRRGKCDSDTGMCACFEGFTGAACSTITALI